MSQRTFWLIVIKIFGIFLVIESVAVLPQAFFTLPMIWTSENEALIVVTAFIVGMILIYLLITRLFLIKPHWLIDKFKLDEGFPDEKIDININQTAVISIACIILGGYLFVDGLPMLCRQLFVLYQEDSLSGRIGDEPSTMYLVQQAVKTIAGYLIVFNHVAFAKFINKHSRIEEVPLSGKNDSQVEGDL